MKKSKVVLVEGECPECSGTGFPVVLQPVRPPAESTRRDVASAVAQDT